MLNHRESIIHKQQEIISLLNNRLLDNGLDALENDEMQTDISILDMDLITDSDSAVVMEDVDSEVSHIGRYGRGGDCVTIVRSVSDAMNANIKYNINRRSSGYLKRPEILETVYSVEEDPDTDQASDEVNDTTKKRNAFANSSKKLCNVNSISQNGSDFKNNCDKETVCRIASWPHLDNLADRNDGTIKKVTTNQVITYNRVMSNHRSVTKPKDVKYKRINKAKSKSLEELRGRLKSWVEQGTKIAGIKLEHGQSYA